MITLLKELMKQGKEVVGTELRAIIDELLRRGGITTEKYTDISLLL